MNPGVHSASCIKPILAFIPSSIKSAVYLLVSIDLLSTFNNIYFLFKASSIRAFYIFSLFSFSTTSPGELRSLSKFYFLFLA